MNEMFCKGKCKGNDEWVYGVPVRTIEKRGGRYDFSKRIIIMPVQSLVIDGKSAEYKFDGSMMFFDELPQEVVPETVGWFTGWRDKNGEMIFTGDIVMCYDFPYEVRFFEDRAAFGLTRIDRKNGKHTLSDWAGLEEALLIIGNIYDNPELLKEGAK